MDVLNSIFFFFLALVVLIFIHELGHFIVARLCGVYVERFSLGFGPVLFSIHDKKGTEYSLSLIPLGGYVKMYEENSSVLDNHSNPDVKPANLGPNQSLKSKKAWQKFLIVAAGPLSNLLLAYVLFVVIFIYGMDSLRPAVDITHGSLAYNSGLRTKDVIKSVGGNQVEEWEDTIYQLVSRIGDKHVQLEVVDNLGKGDLRQVDLSLEGLELDPKTVDVFNILGLRPLRGQISNVINYIEPSSPADKAGLKKGDYVVSFGKRSCLTNKTFINIVKQANASPINLLIASKDGIQTISKTLQITTNSNGKEIVDLTLGENEYILAYNDIYCTNWESLSKYIKTHQNKTFEVVVLRDNQFVKLSLTPMSKTDKNGGTFGYAGISPEYLQFDDIVFKRQYSLIDALSKGVEKTYDTIVITLRFIFKFANGDISYKNISGPVGIAKGAGLTASYGMVYFLSFLAMISVNLGVFNLLPIPALDGAYLIVYLLELVRGKPVSEKVLSILLNIGTLLLLVIMCLAIFNDLYYRW